MAMVCYNRSIHLFYTYIAVHYLSYTVHQISLYGCVQSQQSLFIAWDIHCVYKCKLHHDTVE